MANKRRRYDQKSAMAAGVDYLLRQQERLDRNPGFGTGVTDLSPFKGPIEIDYMVTAFDSRRALINLADYRCSGTDDDIEINAALTQATVNGGVVRLASGLYTVADGATITIPDNTALIGTPWRMEFSATDWASRIWIADDGDVSFVVNGAMRDILVGPEGGG